MPRIIETKIFIEPQEAFQLIGEETYGPNWKREWVDASAAPEHKTVLQYLVAALQSGEVAAHWTTIDLQHSGDITPQEADREFFHIDLIRNRVFHHSMNQPAYCKIHAGQLRSFMRGQEVSKGPATQFAAASCAQWLVERFSNPDYLPPKFEDHLKTAKTLFPRLSNKAFKDARKQAIQITGRDDISKAGRRKKSNQSTI